MENKEDWKELEKWNEQHKQKLKEDDKYKNSIYLFLHQIILDFFLFLLLVYVNIKIKLV